MLRDEKSEIHEKPMSFMKRVVGEVVDQVRRDALSTMVMTTPSIFSPWLALFLMRPTVLNRPSMSSAASAWRYSATGGCGGGVPGRRRGGDRAGGVEDAQLCPCRHAHSNEFFGFVGVFSIMTRDFPPKSIDKRERMS